MADKPASCGRERSGAYAFKAGTIGEGTGLDISRRVVEQSHGGTVAVASRPGETRFTVRLPLRSAA